MEGKKLLLSLIVVSIAIAVLGCAQEVKATIKDYKITDFDGRPAVKVYVETNKFPISLELLGPDRRTVDMNYIESEKDLPAIMYFGLSGQNVKGTYYVELKIGAKTVEEKEIKLQGPKLQLVSSDFNFEHSDLWGYQFKKVSLTLKNVGDCPAYIYWIELTVDGKSPLTEIANEYKTPILPGESKTYTADFSLLSVKEKGKYDVKIKISDSYGNVIGTFSTSANVQ